MYRKTFNEHLRDATEKITLEMVSSLEHGEERFLNNLFKIYKYVEDDIIVVNFVGEDEEEWEEIYQVLTDKDNIVFESLRFVYYEDIFK